MINRVVYGDKKFDIESHMTEQQIRESMQELFPELRQAVALRKGNELHFVTHHRMMQNHLEIELSKLREKELLEELGKPSSPMIGSRRSQTEYLNFHSNMIGHMPGHREEKMKTYMGGQWRDLEDASTISTAKIRAEQIRAAKLASVSHIMNTWFDEPKEEYPYTVGDVYAARGGYEHLVGKKAKVIEENNELEVYIVEVENETKQYVIRKKDIQKL
jgi:hypothetical protein